MQARLWLMQENVVCEHDPGCADASVLVAACGAGLLEVFLLRMGHSHTLNGTSQQSCSTCPCLRPPPSLHAAKERATINRLRRPASRPTCARTPRATSPSCWAPWSRWQAWCSRVAGPQTHHQHQHHPHPRHHSRHVFCQAARLQLPLLPLRQQHQGQHQRQQ